MTIYEESGLSLDLTEKIHFRFEALPDYQTLKGQNIKEMDFVFLHNNRLYFLELKSFQKFITHPQNQTATEKMAELKQSLPKTLTDALLMMCAVWLGTEKSKTLSGGIPEQISQFQSFILLLALDLPEPLKVHLGVLNTALQAALKGYTSLYDADVILLNYETLTERFPFISINENLTS